MIEDSSKLVYILCKYCHHFYDEDFGHLEDGEQEFDHDAEPSSKSYTLSVWNKLRPELFLGFPDGKIGPNSKHFSRKGKTN